MKLLYSNMIKNISYALLYVLAVHFAYVNYISPTFLYADYKYLNFSYFDLFCTYMLSVLPIFSYKFSKLPSQSLASLTFILGYVPIMLSLLFTLEWNYFDIMFVQFLLAISMAVMFYSANYKFVTIKSYYIDFKLLDKLIGLATVIGLSFLIYVNINHMELVSFNDVYDLRFQAYRSNPRRSIFSDYFTSWMIYCFIPYLYARGICHKKFFLLSFGIISAVLIYMSEGHKSALLFLPILLCIHYIWKRSKDFLQSLLLLASIMIFLICIFIPDHDIFIWVKSIILIRFIGSGGWIASKYLEFFTVNGITYYSHIGFINSIFDIYPYGNLSLGQVIGLEYSGTTDANHNGSFWASDGIAALGPWGILVITPAISLLCISINKVFAMYDRNFIVLWLAGFGMAFLNVPLSTALISGGGVLILLAGLYSQKRLNPA